MKIKLPMDEALPAILDELKTSKSLLISAEPGAGKTTRLPPALLSVTDKKILVLEPRRIAAISAAHRIAEENDWSISREIGYQIRFENKTSKDTKIIFLTEALLLRKLLDDPELSEIGCVVLDEFHERSVHIDLALAALKELQELSRTDLKIIVMSATLDTKPLEDYLHAKTISVPGKIFPLEIKHEKASQLLQTNFAFIQRISDLLKKAFHETEGNILCFLPGRGEIERVWDKLTELRLQANIVPLHGQLSIQDQKRSLAQSKERKIILSTNVAESSLTVEGVSVVVDSGLARMIETHPRTGFESMELVRISKASAKQRAGRAARNAPGIVYRAWHPSDELSMKDFETPELHRSDLSESVLLLSALGIKNPNNFSWFESPKEKSLEQAQNFLKYIGAITEEGDLTPSGKIIRNFPVHPRIAKLLLVGIEKKSTKLACELATVLSNPLKGNGYEPESDLLGSIQDWKRSGNKILDLTYSNLISLCDSNSSEDISMEELLIGAYSDRICKRRNDSDTAKMVGGRGIRLHPDSNVKTSEYFLALELKEGRDNAEALVFKAIGLPGELIKKHCEPQAKKTVKLEWCNEKERFWAIESNNFFGISIGSEHKRPPTALEVEGKLTDVLVSKWDLLLQRNSKLSNWWDRIQFLHLNKKFPLLTKDQIRNALDFAALGESEFQSICEKDLISYFESQLEQDHIHALKRECPEDWLVPSGSRMKIKYSQDQGAQVEVRLQELFSLKEAPKVAGQALTLVLLAPNYRPVQVTRDLSSFWTNAYPEVKKELKARYPKHSWPEDPLAATPQAKGRPRSH